MSENRNKYFSFILNSIAYALPITIVIFVVLMYARTIEDEHISGAFALFPVAVILTIFFVRILFEFFRESKTK